MMQILSAYTWVIPTVLESAIVVAMLVRGLHKKLPYFFVFVGYDALNTIPLLALRKHVYVYFYAYWYSELIGWILALAVIHEIYANLLKEYAALQKLGALLFWIMGVVFVLIALWIGLSAPSKPELRFTQEMLMLERSIRVVQGGLLVALFLFASLFGLSWKNYLFGIALGLATFAFVELAVVAVRAYAGAGEHMLYRWLKPVSYDLTVLLWAAYLLRPAREAYLRTLPKTELAAWNDALQELLHR